MRRSLPSITLTCLLLSGCGLAETAATGAAGAAAEAEQARQAKQIEEHVRQQAEAAVQLDAQKRTEAEKQGD
jgi:hypothetical protein